MTTENPPPIASAIDESHLNSLAIGHYVLAGITALFSLFPLIHVAMGLMFVLHPAAMADKHGSGPPAFVGWMFVMIGATFILLGEACAVCIFLSGRYLKQRRRYLFSFIVGCIACAMFPLGPVLGVFTIIVLSRESVKKLYHRTFA